MSSLRRSARALLCRSSSIAVISALAASFAFGQSMLTLEPIEVARPKQPKAVRKQPPQPKAKRTVRAPAPPVAAPAAPRVPVESTTEVPSKIEENLTASLAGVSVVRSDLFNRIQPSSVSEAMRAMPGVWFQERGDAPESAINIRGLQDFGRVAVVIDGARQNFQRSGHNANGTFFLDPELVGGIDVVRGPVANIYGSGAIGGVVSFRTKDVDDILRSGERIGGELHGVGGTNQGRVLGSFFGAARPTDTIDLIAGAAYRSQGNYRDGNGKVVANSAFTTASELAKVAFRPLDGHEVKLSTVNLDSNYNTGQQFPNQESVYDTHVRNTIANARWRYNRPDDRVFDFQGNVYWTETIQDQHKIGNGTPGSLGNPITGFVGGRRSFSIETRGFDVHNTSRFDLGPWQNALTVGGDAFQDEVNNVDRTGNGAVTTPNGVRTVSGAFSQWRANYGTWLEIIGAARYDQYALDGGGTHANGDHLSPKITAGITPPNWGMTFYGTYAEGYRAPAVTETLVAGAHPPFAVGFPNLFTFVPNPSLRPEIGHTKEFGINFKYDNILRPDDKLRAKLNLFRNEVTDFIDLVTFGPPVRTCPPGAPIFLCNAGIIPLITVNNYSFVQHRNIADGRIEGIELEANYDQGDWFAILQGHRIRGEEIANGQPLSTIPPDQIATTFGVRWLDRKLTTAARVQLVAAKKASDIPDRDGDGIPDFLPTAAYNLVNLYVGYQINPNTLASLSIDNLFNQFYIPYLVGTPNIPGNPPGVVFPGAGITIKGSLKARFGA